MIKPFNLKFKGKNLAKYLTFKAFLCKIAFYFYAFLSRRAKKSLGVSFGFKGRKNLGLLKFCLVVARNFDSLQNA